MAAGREVMLVCEDQLSADILVRMVSHARPQLSIRSVEVTRGNARIAASIGKYARASQAGVAHIILTDLDRAACPPSLLAEWKVPEVPGYLLFRIAVREVEAWLLADQPGLAKFLGIPAGKISVRPDEVNDPKETLMNLVRRCRNIRLKQDILPETGSSAKKGVFYNERFGHFARKDWNIERAAKMSPSLRKALLRIGGF